MFALSGLRPQRRCKLNVTDKRAQHPNINGVYHDEEGYGVATDTHTLVYDTALYDESHKGQIVATHANKSAGIKKGDTIEGRFPNWRSVLPNYKGHATVDLGAMRKFLQGVEERLQNAWAKKKSAGENVGAFAEYKENARVAIRTIDGEVHYFPYETLRKAAAAAESMGASELYHGGVENAFHFTGDRGGVLAMPVRYLEDSGHAYYYDLKGAGGKKRMSLGEGEPTVTSEGGGGESAAGEFTPGISDEVRQKLEDAIDEEYKVKTEGSDEAEEVAERKARERELKLLGIEEDYEPDAKEAKRRAKQKEKARAERWRAAAEERDRRKQEIGVVDKIAKSLGLEVRLYEGPAEENGYIQGNTIYVNSNAAEGEGLRFVAGHEMTHSMEDAAVAAKRKEAYDQAIAEGKSAEDAERAAQEWEDHYRSTGEGLEGTGRVSRHR